MCINNNAYKEKKITKRGDIWLAKLESKYGQVFQAEHPVILLSCWRSQAKSDLIYVLPLSSKNKNKIYHSKIEASYENGLDADSYGLCEQIAVIPRENLIKYLGKASWENMKDAQRLIMNQLGFDNYISKDAQVELDKQISYIRELDEFINANLESNKDTEMLEIIRERITAYKCMEKFCINNNINTINLERYNRKELEKYA